MQITRAFLKFKYFPFFFYFILFQFRRRTTTKTFKFWCEAENSCDLFNENFSVKSPSSLYLIYSRMRFLLFFEFLFLFFGRIIGELEVDGIRWKCFWRGQWIFKSIFFCANIYKSMYFMIFNKSVHKFN